MIPDSLVDQQTFDIVRQCWDVHLDTSLIAHVVQLPESEVESLVNKLLDTRYRSALSRESN